MSDRGLVWVLGVSASIFVWALVIYAAIKVVF